MLMMRERVQIRIVGRTIEPEHAMAALIGQVEAVIHPVRIACFDVSNHTCDELVSAVVLAARTENENRVGLIGARRQNKRFGTGALNEFGYVTPIDGGRNH